MWYGCLEYRLQRVGKEWHFVGVSRVKRHGIIVVVSIVCNDLQGMGWQVRKVQKVVNRCEQSGILVVCVTVGSKASSLSIL